MSDEWPAPNFWCTICNRGAEACFHNPSDVKFINAVPLFTDLSNQLRYLGKEDATE